MRPLLIALLLACPLLLAAEKTYDDGYEPRPPAPFPAEYQDYQILPGSFSPGKTYGVIYPKRSVLYSIDAKLLVARLKPFGIVREVPLGDSTLAANAHGSYEIHWARDASAVVVVEGLKWGPDKVFLVPITGAKPGKIVDLAEKVHALLQPNFAKAKAKPFNDDVNFIFETDDAEKWTFARKGSVLVDCLCTTDPKRLDTDSWTVHFRGLWAVHAGAFAEKKFTRVVRKRFDEE